MLQKPLVLKIIWEHIVYEKTVLSGLKKGFSPVIIMKTLNYSNLTMIKGCLGVLQDDINQLYGV